MRVNAFRKRALTAVFAGSVYPGSVLISENARPIWATVPIKAPNNADFSRLFALYAYRRPDRPPDGCS